MEMTRAEWIARNEEEWKNRPLTSQQHQDRFRANGFDHGAAATQAVATGKPAPANVLAEILVVSQ